MSDSYQHRSDRQRARLTDRELLEDMITGFGSRTQHHHQNELPSLDVSLIEEHQLQGTVTPINQKVGLTDPVLSIDHCYEIVLSLSLGQSLLMTQENGQVLEMQLAWINQATGKYLFTDEQGNKVAERSFRDLATALKRGDLKLSSKPPVVNYPASQASA